VSRAEAPAERDWPAPPTPPYTNEACGLSVQTGQDVIDLFGAGFYTEVLLLRDIFLKARNSLLTGNDYARLRIAVLFVFLAYNATEGGWRATHLSFLVLLLVGVEVTLVTKARTANDRDFGRARRVLSNRTGEFAELPSMRVHAARTSQIRIEQLAVRDAVQRPGSAELLI
jgi:hypothetical protein